MARGHHTNLDLNTTHQPELTMHADVVGGRNVQYYSMREGTGVTLFDCGLATGQNWWSDDQDGDVPCTTLIVSHADVDHFGNASALKSVFPHLRVCAHAADQRWIEDPEALVMERYDHARAAFNFGYSAAVLSQLRQLSGGGVQVDELLEENGVVTIGACRWVVLHVPGHSPGHIALWEAASGTLLFGDAVLGLGVPGTSGGVSMPPTHQFIASYLDTIARLHGLPVKVALSGHWPPLNGIEFRQLLTDSRFCVERDLAFVRAEIKAVSHSFASLLASLNARFRTWPADQDEHYSYALGGYIEYLEDLQQVTVTDAGIKPV